MFANSRILITGGTGTLGHELARQLMDFNCSEIIIYSRNEVAQVEMKRRYPSLTYVIGDIRDESAVKKVLKKIDIVYHLAAIKHVPICENQPMEAVKTNILGTQNIINNCKGRLISMSTDKAVNPSCVYGYTKAISEVNVLNYGGINIRSGNIFGSSGSVVPFFISQIKTQNKITLTNGEMTRYFIKVDDLATFILNTTSQPKGIYYPIDMSAYRMRDIAETIVSIYGNDKTEIIETGARVGEKLHESMDGIHYSNNHLSNAKELFNELATRG
jgi:UDP-N-acetylglucosamine 4,6-dehydratase/5-epimerase